MPWWKKILLGLLLTGLVGLLALMGAKAAWDSRYYDGYSPALALNPVIVTEEERPGYLRSKVTFEGLAGQPVPALLARPKDGSGPWPCVIFLHGIGQKKEFLDEIAPIFVEGGFALVCFDQYTRGERKIPELGAVKSVLALRRRAALNVIETRRLVDYLQTRSDIAGNRIYMVGASFGAITGSTAAAFEPRIRGVVLTYGGGNMRVLLASQQAAAALGWWMTPVKYLGAYLFSAADPIRYVKQISPRPVLFQCGEADTMVPPASGQALFDAAAEPKKITWYAGDHVGLDADNTRRVLDEGVAWLKAQDAAVVPSSGVVSAAS